MAAQSIELLLDPDTETTLIVPTADLLAFHAEAHRTPLIEGTFAGLRRWNSDEKADYLIG